ncbi:stage V sporulation protein S [Desulfovirgula thermocuniculi]|uniref:stage V sporulation protein S n=1 Tax=Desulfovirgula thermocuniculi TaxID=348842 RepID=UPI00048799A1|nr:stage V sporulation protein S [Desulfovirgula thermocuniculi]
METFKVSTKTDTKKLAWAIYHVLKGSEGEVTLRAIGAGAVNQAVKAMAVARGLVAPLGYDLKMVPAWETLAREDGTELTAIKFHVFR